MFEISFAQRQKQFANAKHLKQWGSTMERISGYSRSETYRRLAAGDIEAVKAKSRTSRNRQT
jgi:hypothetical protein